MMFNIFFKKILAFILFYSGLVGILRILGQRYAKIILYHSTCDNEHNFIKGTNIWISDKYFEKHLKYLAKHYRIISLKNLVENLKKNKIPANSIVITFDDGFADNFTFAYSLLKKYKMNATIFLSTDCIEEKKLLWIQEINYLINNFGLKKIVHEIGKINGLKEIYKTLVKHANHKNGNKLIIESFSYLCDKETRDKTIDRLYRRFKINKKQLIHENHIFLSWNEIHEMKKNNISFGNHGASHTPFSVLPLKMQQEEIEHSMKVIKNHLGLNFLPFAYPFGTDKDFTSETKMIVKNTGHDCILTTMHNSICSHSSPFDLGRIDLSNIPVYYLAFELEKHIFRKLWLKAKFA